MKRKLSTSYCSISFRKIFGAGYCPSVFLIILLFLGSCSPRLTTPEPPIEEPEPFLTSGTAAIPDEWWTAFDDPTLNELVEEALRENLALAGNWEEFRAALAIVDRESSFLFPEISGVGGYSTERRNGNSVEPDQFEAGLSASYELDLWGRVRAGIQAEEFRAEATLNDYQAAAMTLSAETSLTWYRLVTARKQLALVREQIATNEDIIRLIRARFTSGQVRAVDILRQEQLLQSTRAEEVFYETQVELLENELAVLLGNPPQNSMQIKGDSLPELPPLPATGLPLELIRQRPDVRQAYHLVLAADREVAEAIRSKYPRISIDAGILSSSGNVGNLFQNWAYSLAGNLIAPLFYGGRLEAEVDRTEALKNQRLFQYGQTVLLAFQEVENALFRELKQAEALEILERRVELAQTTTQQLRLEYLNGISNYLEVLLSLDQEQELQREYLEARLVQIENRIALYRALAASFETERTDLP